MLHERWQDAFEEGFATQYNTIHRLETNKLRNVAKLFGHLLHTDSVSWAVLGCIHLNEDDTTSSSRIFIKILVQEMAEAMGMVTLKQRFDTDNPDPDGPVGEDAVATTTAAPSYGKHQQHEQSSREWFKGMFPKDNARNTRYAINFFTSIGLGPLTDGMREFLKNAPKLILAQAQAQAAKEAAQRDNKDDDESSVISSSSSDTSSGSSSSSSSSMSSSSSSSYSSDSRYRRRRNSGKGRGRDRKRDSRRSRSYSSSSSSGSDSSPDSRGGGGRKKYSSKENKRGGGRRGGRASSNSRDRKDDAGKDSRNDGVPSKAPTPDTGSKKRSVSASPPARRGRKEDRRHSRRSYSSSRSRSPARGSLEKGRGRGGGGDGRSRSNGNRKSPPGSPPDKKLEKQPPQERSEKKKRARSSSSSFSSASRSRSPPARKSSRRGSKDDDGGDGKYSRRGRKRSESQSVSPGRN